MYRSSSQLSPTHSLPAASIQFSTSASPVFTYSPLLNEQHSRRSSSWLNSCAQAQLQHQSPLCHAQKPYTGSRASFSSLCDESSSNMHPRNANTGFQARMLLWNVVRPQARQKCTRNVPARLTNLARPCRK